MPLSNRPPDARDAIHGALTVIMLWLGFVLIQPASTFDTSSSFAVMQELATEDHWAMAFFFVGILGGAGMVTRSKVLRLVSVLILATAHGVFAICLFRANTVSTGTGTYGCIAALGYYLCARRTIEGI